MLGIIIGYAELLENKLSKQPKLAKYAHEIHYASQRGAKLTKKLLAFSRQKSSEADVLNINTLLQSQRHMLEKTLTVRIRLVLDLAKDLWPVWLDSNDMEDAIINMSINAMHAIKGSGQLTICTSNEAISTLDATRLGIDAQDYVSLSITDTGCGMDETIREKIFDPFYSTKKERGTGLGLSQVYGFVKHNNGTIKVYSEPQHGTEFILYFPRHLESKHTKKSASDNKTTTNKGTETILVVDDEAALLNLTCEILNQQGYITLCAKKRSTGFRYSRKENY